MRWLRTRDLSSRPHLTGVASRPLLATMGEQPDCPDDVCGVHDLPYDQVRKTTRDLRE